MNRVGFFSVLILIFSFSMICSSCNTSYESMLGEYNGCFGQTTGTKSPATMESVVQTEMIPYNDYEIYFDYIFSISAPEGGLSYTWIIKDENGTTVFEQKTEENRLNRVLQFKPSKSKLSEGTYYLTLQVETKKSTYTDDAKLKLKTHN